MQFLYLGFSQQANIRCYRFQVILGTDRPARVSPRAEYRLSADISLLLEHHIRIQDGPALCLGILSAGFSGAESSPGQVTSYAITHQDLSAYSTAQTAAQESKLARRRQRPPFRARHLAGSLTTGV